jgi:exosortase/archaeosortase family protein
MLGRGALDAAPLRWGLARRELFLWVGLILLAHYVSDYISLFRQAHARSADAYPTEFFSIDAFRALAWYAVFSLARRSDSARPSTPLDVATAVVLCAIDLVPHEKILWIVASAAAAYFFITSANDLSLRAAAIVLGALSVNELWARGLFRLVTFDLLRADAAIVGSAMAATREGVVWHDNIITMPSGHSIQVLAGCSSFHNLSLALLCWVTVSKLTRPKWRKRDFAVAAIVCAAMIALNVARIYLMALDLNSYRFWHEGFGAEIFVLGASFITVLICLCGASLGRSEAR